MGKEQLLSSVSKTRNSWAREKSAGAVQTVVNILHHASPDISPTHLNALGVTSVALGAKIAASRTNEGIPEDKAKTVAAGILLVGGTSFDAVDGQLARTIAAEDSEKVDFKKGQLYDVLTDRSQEFFMALSRATSARKRGSKIGEAAAYLAGATTALPGAARAYVESTGYAVPEAGASLSGVLGSRMGRVITGIVTTLAPEIKGVSTQPIMDAAVAGSNIVNTVNRLQYAHGKKNSAVLSQDVRQDARERLRTLALFGAAAVGTTAYLCLKNRQSKPEQIQAISGAVDPEWITTELSDNQRYVKTLGKMEKYFQERGIDHCFVGGTVTDLVGPQTEFDIDATSQTIRLKNSKPLEMKRSDGSTKDIDVVIFCKDRQKFFDSEKDFSQWEQRAKQNGISFPQISLEAARYPDWPKRSKLKQFVSAFEVDREGNPSLAFGEIQQPISKESLESWKLQVDEKTQISVLHPFAHALCYGLRVPSGVKQKDREIKNGTDDQGNPVRFNKMTLVMKYGREALRQEEKEGKNGKEKFDGWISYIQTLQKHPDPLTRAKAKITRWYWNSNNNLGTQISHGTGIFGKFSRFSDRMNG